MLRAMSRASEKAAFYVELATLLGGGVPMGKALESLERHTSSPRLAAAIRAIRESCSNGMPLADAMAGQPVTFEAFEVCVVRAGEKAGRLSEVLLPISAEWERVDRGRRRVLGAIGYPVLLVHVAALAGSVLEMVNGGFGAFLGSLALKLGTIYSLGLVLLLLTSRGAMRSLEEIWTHVPIVGQHLKNTWLERFLLVLRLQVESGALYSEALPQALMASGSVALERAAVPAGQAALRGESVVEALEPVFRFAPELRSFFATAETSGRLAEVLAFVESRVRERRERSGALLVEWVPRLIYFCALGWAAWTVLHMAMGYYQQVNEALDSANQ
jgi:type IV pilus assembly protein PilC